MPAPATTCILVGQHQFPASASPQDDAALLVDLAKCVKREKKLHKYVKAASKKPDPAGATIQATEIYLRSPATRFAVAVEMNKQRPLHDRLALDQLRAMADGLDVFKANPEEVHAFTFPKMSGGIRVLSAFGPANRTAQRSVCNVLSLQFHGASFQYDRKGAGGVPRAVLDFVALIKLGCHHVEHLDAKNFFGSFSETKLPPELLLPQAVVESVVLGRHLNIKTTGKVAHPYLHNNNTNILKTARQGIPQGAATSPLVGAMMVSRLNWKASADVALISYVDDFYLVAKTENALKSAAQALRAAFEALPGGHFTLITKFSGHAGDGIPILGHDVTLEPDGKITIELNEANSTIADDRFEELEVRALILAQAYLKEKNETRKQLVVDAVARLLGSASAWAAAFKLCLGVKDALLLVKYKAVDIVQKCGLDKAEVIANANVLGGWKWGLYPNDY